MDADLAPPDLAAWLHLVWGVLVLLAPGLAAADRVFAERRFLTLAPVFSFSLLPIVAIALDFGLGVPIHVVTTHIIALGLAVWIGRRRLVQLWGLAGASGAGGVGSVARARHDARRSAGGHPRWRGAGRHAAARASGHAALRGAGRHPGWGAGRHAAGRASGDAALRGAGRHPGWRGAGGRAGWHGGGPGAWALLAILPFLMLVHGLQHVPGDSPADEPSSAWDAYPSLARHAVDALQGDQYPYPIHVDDHNQMAHMAQVDRQKTADIVDPYTKLPQRQDLFSVQGMRSERGYDVANVQLHHLTGLSFAAIARWVPAIWTGFLGLAVFMALRPAPGALAAVALVAVLPSDVRFLGVAYLVPSAFGLPWIFVTLLVAQRATGAGRFFGLVLLITAAHFMHLVIGVLTLLAAVTGTLVRADAAGRRASMLVAALLPLVWILPATLGDARAAVADENPLPFNTPFLGIPGAGVYVLAAVGAALAWWRPARINEPHRALSLMAIPMAMSLLLSIRFEHSSDATYARQVFAFFLTLIALASYGLADSVRRLAAFAGHDRLALVRRASTQHAVVAAVVIVMLAAPLAHHMQYEPYRVHGPTSWAAAEALARSDVGPGDVLLSHPWEAPIYNSITGAIPYAVLYPGSPPVRGSEWDFYVQSRGADAEWLEERGITVVVAAVAPNAPFRLLAPNVYRVG